jgi:excinuclease UvrABC nuclease subunit
VNVSSLNPSPTQSEPFRRDRANLIPQTSGCYVLCRYEGTILYIGLTVNLRRRMLEHLDVVEKTTETINGRATLFYWLETEALEQLERTWLNSYEIEEGVPPILNKAKSPISGM